MATTAALPATRAEIFRQGLKNAPGRVTRLGKGWGTITYEGASRVKYHFVLSDFPEWQRKEVLIGLPVIFDAEGGQIDTTQLRLPAGSDRHYPNISRASLVNVNR
jgi:hypothetical protein